VAAHRTGPAAAEQHGVAAMDGIAPLAYDRGSFREDPMKSDLSELVDLAIAIEHACAGVYDVFSSAFADDETLRSFWGTYAEAERYHGAMIALHRAAFLADDADPGEFPMELGESRRFLEQLEAWQERYTAHPPSRGEAFALAERIEAHTAELHGRRQFYGRQPQLADLFERMVQEDEDHRRLLADAQRA
jgi:hypothetical protein